MNIELGCLFALATIADLNNHEDEIGREFYAGLIPFQKINYQGKKKLSDVDIKVIYSFLQSTTPVSNIVPPSILKQP